MLVNLNDGNVEVSEKGRLLISTSNFSILGCFFKRYCIHEVSCSSSVDFPEEYGFNSNVREKIAEALTH
jgi:hypothetical protein